VATANQVQPAEEIVASVKANLLRDLESGGHIPPAYAVQLHRAIDLLRAARAEPVRVARIETISCLMHPMPLMLRQGRVNAYASTLQRLRRAADQL